MSALFDCPPGAIQFHVTRNTRRKKDVDFYVLVRTAEKRIDFPNQCACEWVFPVIVESIGSEAIAQGAAKNNKAFVCRCMGEVIP